MPPNNVLAAADRIILEHFPCDLDEGELDDDDSEGRVEIDCRRVAEWVLAQAAPAAPEPLA